MIKHEITINEKVTTVERKLIENFWETDKNGIFIHTASSLRKMTNFKIDRFASWIAENSKCIITTGICSDCGETELKEKVCHRNTYKMALDGFFGEKCGKCEYIEQHSEPLDGIYPTLVREQPQTKFNLTFRSISPLTPSNNSSIAISMPSFHMTSSADPSQPSFTSWLLSD